MRLNKQKPEIQKLGPLQKCMATIQISFLKGQASWGPRVISYRLMRGYHMATRPQDKAHEKQILKGKVLNYGWNVRNLWRKTIPSSPQLESHHSWGHPIGIMILLRPHTELGNSFLLDKTFKVLQTAVSVPPKSSFMNPLSQQIKTVPCHLFEERCCTFQPSTLEVALYLLRSWPPSG